MSANKQSDPSNPATRPGSKDPDASKAPGRPKLDSVTDAPESGEPLEQGHRTIEKPGSSKGGSK